MNVLEATQSFQSMIDSISTTTDQYVSKDLFQTCMASFANSFIQLSQNVNQLSWSFRSGIQTLSDQLSHLDEATQTLHTNNAKLSDRIDSNNTNVLKNIKQLSDRIEYTDTINKQQSNLLLNRLNKLEKSTSCIHDRLNKLEESSSCIQDSINNISDRLDNAESSISSSHKIISALSDNVLAISETVDNLDLCYSTLMSKCQNQQVCLENLTSDIEKLQKSNHITLHSTPKPPPGITPRSISNPPFFVPPPPPGFEIASTLHHSHDCTIDSQSLKPGTIKSGELSPFDSVSATNMSQKMPVSKTDKDGTADLSHDSAAPAMSFTVSAADPDTTEMITPHVLDQITLQSTNCTLNQSDSTSQSVTVIPNDCQSFSNHHDSGIVSMVQFDQNLPMLSPVKTVPGLSEIDNCNSNQSFVHITSLQTKTEGERSKEIVYACSASLHLSGVVKSSDIMHRTGMPVLTPCLTSPPSMLPSITSIEEQNMVLSELSEPTLEICVDPVKALTENVPYTGLNQPADSSVKSFEQVIQSEGHTEYGRLHPVRRPWKLMYLTLRWLKPFK